MNSDNIYLKRKEKLIAEFKEKSDRRLGVPSKPQKKIKNLFGHLNIDILPETIKWYEATEGRSDYE